MTPMENYGPLKTRYMLYSHSQVPMSLHIISDDIPKELHLTCLSYCWPLGQRLHTCVRGTY